MYKKDLHIHFVGIGGIGMSGIAQIFAQKGFRVSGCDSDNSQKSISKLLSLGCSISQSNNSDACHDDSIGILVYSSAISQTNPEILRARERGIPVVHRSLMLAELMRDHYGIGITGSHGKTTTSSLIAHLLLQADFDPTIVVGGSMHNIDNNAYYGRGKFLVAEADESDRSLLNLPICYGVVTNIDLEHLETYSSIEDITDTFEMFLRKIPFYGKVFMCVDDTHAQKLTQKLSHVISYGIDESAHWKIINVTLNSDDSVFSLLRGGITHGPFIIPLPGIHNVKNATASILVAHTLEIPWDTIQKGLLTFKGVDRRFTYKGTYNGATIFDDYGHHPEEIFHSLKVAYQKKKGRLILLFQPHRYSRTEALWNEFIRVLSSSTIDELILTDIYPASETPREGITSERLLRELKNLHPSIKASYIPLDYDFKGIEAYLKTHLKPDDLLLIQGAGKVNSIVSKLIF